MTDEDAIAAHKALAEYHTKLSKQSILDIFHEYHSDLAERMAYEVARITREVKCE